MREEDRHKFVKLAERRVQMAIKQIRLIGNLSNRSNYDYAEDDVRKIFKALNAELAQCKQRFDTALLGRSNGVDFSLED